MHTQCGTLPAGHGPSAHVIPFPSHRAHQPDPLRDFTAEWERWRNTYLAVRTFFNVG